MRDTTLLSRFEQKRQQILDAIRELFMAQGCAETSMDFDCFCAGWKHWDWDDAILRYLGECFAQEFGQDLLDTDINELLVKAENATLQ